MSPNFFAQILIYRVEAKALFYGAAYWPTMAANVESSVRRVTKNIDREIVVRVFKELKQITLLARSNSGHQKT